jgi:hypothetical protein
MGQTLSFGSICKNECMKGPGYALVFICIILDLILICTKLLSISSYITDNNNVSFQLYSARWRCVRRSETWYGSICFWNTIQLPPPPPTFLILKLFIRCLLVGVREGLGVGISLSYKWKQIGVFFRRIVYVYEVT